jgi:hypothetical protein
MCSKVYDDTGDYIHVINNDVPNGIGQSLSAFDFFTQHFGIRPDRVDDVLLKDYPIEDYEWWHGMSPPSGPDETLIRQYQSEYRRYLPIQNLFEQNVVLQNTPGFRPDSPSIDPDRPPGKLVELRVWLVYPLMEIQEFPKRSHSFTKIAEAVFQDLTRVVELEKKSGDDPIQYDITMVPLFADGRIRSNFMRNRLTVVIPWVMERDLMILL